MTGAGVRRDTIAARRAAGSAGRQRIVEAAVAAIETHGVDAGLAAIAGQAGVPRPHVYRHFTGKDDLDQEVARHAAGLLSEWIRPSLVARGTPPRIIYGIIGRVLGWALDHPNLYRFRAGIGSPAAVGELGDAVAAYLRHTARPPAHVMAGLIGLVDGAIVWWLDHRDETGPDQLTDWLAAQVWQVLAAVVPVDADTELDPA